MKKCLVKSVKVTPAQQEFFICAGEKIALAKGKELP